MAGWFDITSAAGIFSALACSFHRYYPTHFCNPRIDAEDAQLAKLPPSPAATKLSAKIEHQIAKQAPWVPLFTPKFASLISHRLGNYQASTYGLPLFDQMWVK